MNLDFIVREVKFAGSLSRVRNVLKYLLDMDDPDTWTNFLAMCEKEKVPYISDWQRSRIQEGLPLSPK